MTLSSFLNFRRMLIPVGLLLVMLIAGSSIAVGGSMVSTTAIAPHVPGVVPLLSYQGRLVDPATGAPKADGIYEMSFRLYTVASGGAALWTETRDVQVSNGVFSVLLGEVTGLNTTHFNGQELWLAIKVGADAEATPRQHLAHVAYALFAENTALLNGQPSTAFATAAHAHSGGDITSGTVADGRVAPTIARDNEVFSIVTGLDGAGSGLDADLLDGLNSSSFAAAVHNHDAAYINSVGPDAMTGSNASPILQVTQSGTGNGLTVSTASTQVGKAGVYGVAGASGTVMNSHSGVFGDSKLGRGVAGVSDSNDGVIGFSTSGTGVTGQSIDGYGINAYSQNKAAVHASGYIEADSFQYNTPRTHYLSIPGEAFHPGSDVAYVNSYGNGGAYISSGSGAMVAPVYLPDGATVTRLTVYFNDSSSSDITLNLNRLSFTNGGYTILASVTSSGSAGYQNGNDTTIGSSVINNVGGGYLAYAYSSSWNSSLKLMGVLITYTISEAP